MDSNMTVTGDSSFKHLANALRTRNRQAAAAYIEGLSHGMRRTDLTARECWKRIRSVDVALEILFFLRDSVDALPEECKRALAVANDGGGMDSILAVCEDPFAACEGSMKFAMELSKAEMQYIEDLVGQRLSDEPDGLPYAQSIYNAARAALGRS